MIQLISILLVAQSAGTPLKAHDLYFASEAKLKQVVGPRTSPPREPGIRFAHPGYYEVWFDSAGPGMNHIRLGLGRLIPWKQYLKEIGLGASHVTATSVPLPASPIPLYRNKFTLTGVTGVPMTHSHQPWRVSFVEYAVANKKRLRELKEQIQALPVGEGRNALIKSCYDWWSEIDLTGH